MNPRSLTTFPATLLLASLCTAQAPTLSTDGPVGVFATNPSGNPSSFIPGGVTVEFESEQQVSTDLLPFGNPTASSAIFAIDHGDSIDLLGLAVLDSGMHQNSDTGTGDASGMSAPVSWLWTLPGPRTGVVRLRSFAQFLGTSGEFVAEIDIGADGSIEAVLAGPHSGTVDLTVDAPGGLVIRATLFSRVQASSLLAMTQLVSHSLSLTYIANGGLTPAAIGPIDGFTPNCGGPLYLSDLPTATQHQLTYTARGNAPGSTTWLLLGLQPVVPAFPIPGTPNCILEALPIVVVSNSADGLGDSVWSLPISGPILDTTLFAQSAALDPMTAAFTTSESLRAYFND